MSRGWTRFIQTPTSLRAASSKAMVFEPSRPTFARRLPTQVGPGADSIVLSGSVRIGFGSAGTGTGTLLDAATGRLVGAGASTPFLPMAIIVPRPASTAAHASAHRTACPRRASLRARPPLGNLHITGS
jgi:hypothetical protein